MWQSLNNQDTSGDLMGQAEAVSGPLPAWLSHEALGLELPPAPLPQPPAQASQLWPPSTSNLGEAWLALCRGRLAGTPSA